MTEVFAQMVTPEPGRGKLTVLEVLDLMHHSIMFILFKQIFFVFEYYESLPQ